MRYLHQALSEEEDEEASVTANGIRFQGTGYALLSLGVRLKTNFYIFPARLDVFLRLMKLQALPITPRPCLRK
jgi:hypothetical protein